MDFIDENFWIAISFIIFLYFAYQPIKKAIINSLDAKITEIRDKLAETEKLRNDAKALFEDAQKEIAHFEEYKTKILESAKNSTNQLVEIRTKEFESMLARSKDSALKSIDNQRDKAAIELRDQFTDSVIKLVRNYLVDTKNNGISDQEIIERFLKKNNQTSE